MEQGGILWNQLERGMLVAWNEEIQIKRIHKTEFAMNYWLNQMNLVNLFG